MVYRSVVSQDTSLFTPGSNMRLEEFLEDGLWFLDYMHHSLHQYVI